MIMFNLKFIYSIKKYKYMSFNVLYVASFI